ncbi:hypothetical protein [Chryseobacterium sp. GP-SGM7]|uniref:hypothetical protein n=1 Tax=Chryseobacterium sp. GP-SGM7 TaxID=3411323 RepID=UPI003B934799
MKQSDLLNYLQNKISAIDLLEKYKDDVESYKIKMSKKGSSVNVNFDYSNETLFINRDTVVKLYKDFIDDRLDFYLMSYIADILTLYNNVDFENEDVRENIETIVDYDNIKNFSKDFLKKQLSSII